MPAHYGMRDSDWSVDRQTGNIRYIGADHIRYAGDGSPGPSYATVIQFHRWLQDKADDASYSGNDELDIIDETPSERSTDNIITLINGYQIDDITAQHLYDGSIIQDSGNIIYDGIVNFGNEDIAIQIIQNGALLRDTNSPARDWWNTLLGSPQVVSGGLNSDSAAGISHRFMVKTRIGGVDIDGRRLIGTCRRFGKTYNEFKINGTSRGNNVLALSDSTDLNNQTVIATVASWTAVNQREGYNEVDVDNDGDNEFFYSRWDRTTITGSTINRFYEKMKWYSRDGSSSTLYGLDGELFRGITHEITLNPASGTGVWPVSTGAGDPGWTSVSWSGGTGQVLAINAGGGSPAPSKMWIQLLTGVAPTDTQVITSGTSPQATATASGTAIERTISVPFCGVSTGSALIGAYGFSLEYADMSKDDILTALDGVTYSPPNNVTFTVFGVISGEDRVLVGPAFAGALNQDQFRLKGAITSGDPSITVDGTHGGQAEPNGTGTLSSFDTPATGTIRIADNNGLFHRVTYTGYTVAAGEMTFTGCSGAPTASDNNGVFISYLDTLATGGSPAVGGTTTAVFNSVHPVAEGARSLFGRVRDGGGTPIKTFETTASKGNTGGSITTIRTSDA